LPNNCSASKKEAIYENRVFLIRNLGIISPTEARRISFEETVRFEKIHEGLRFRTSLGRAKKSGGTREHNQSGNLLDRSSGASDGHTQVARGFLRRISDSGR
jgi:hypothetical protein